jgi:hypothetical protein
MAPPIVILRLEFSPNITGPSAEQIVRDRNPTNVSRIVLKDIVVSKLVI